MKAPDEPEYREYVEAKLDTMRRLAFLLCGDWRRGDAAVRAAFEKLYVNWKRATRFSVDLYVRQLMVRGLQSAPGRGAGSTPPPTESGGALNLSEALATLSEVQRTVVVLRYWDERSVAEVSTILGIPQSTVEQQAENGARSLRELNTVSQNVQ